MNINLIVVESQYLTGSKFKSLYCYKKLKLSNLASLFTNEQSHQDVFMRNFTVFLSLICKKKYAFHGSALDEI